MEKGKYIESFEAALTTLVGELKEYISTETGEWTIKGFIDIYKNIYTISSDTKIVSKILEIHLFPLILQFAENNGYKIELADHQNYYPDLTLINKENNKIKFALDIKTTYRKGDAITGFTLGSHGSYFKERDKDKNIQYPYSQYTGHYCLGVIYSRADFEEELIETIIHQVRELEEEYGNKADPIGERKVTSIENLNAITSVIRDFDFFATAKWKIASDSRGSGNTANIGSIKNIKDLKEGNGVFSKLGESWFDEYWINYGEATLIENGKTIKITNIWDFLTFKGREDLFKKVGRGAKRKRKRK